MLRDEFTQAIEEGERLDRCLASLARECPDHAAQIDDERDVIRCALHHALDEATK